MCSSDLLFPALVQGKTAPDSIAKALFEASRTDCDSIILARGGGSAEDLSAFNTEKVAYAVFNSSVPVISAVGHETDLTIADMAADLRAPTPSAAAEMASLSIEQLRGNVAFFDDKLESLIKSKTELAQNRLMQVLERGYSLVYRNGVPVTKGEALFEGDVIEIHMSDKTVRAKVCSGREESQ